MTDQPHDWLADVAVDNLQCRHIAGVPSADAAIEYLSRSNCEWDTIANLDQLVARIAHRVGEPRLVGSVARHNAAPTDVTPSDELRDLYASINAEDLKLFAWARQNPRPAATPIAAEPAARQWAASLASNSSRAWRNVVYRPQLQLHRRRQSGSASETLDDTTC